LRNNEVFSYFLIVVDFEENQRNQNAWCNLAKRIKENDKLSIEITVFHLFRIKTNFGRVKVFQDIHENLKDCDEQTRD
jgi:hypothetical protein